MRAKGLLKILFTLLLVASFAFLMVGCPWDDESKDEATCNDAAKNIIDLYIDEGYSQAEICDDLWSEIDYWDFDDEAECNAKSFPDEFETFAIDELSDFCEYDNWSQSEIDCLAGCDTFDDLSNCF